MWILREGWIHLVREVVSRKRGAISEVAGADNRHVSGIGTGFISLADLQQHGFGGNSGERALAQIRRIGCRVAGFRNPFSILEHFLNGECAGDVVNHRWLIAQGNILAKERRAYRDAVQGPESVGIDQRWSSGSQSR